MIGTWQRFGEGTPPFDGEALVYIRSGQMPEVLYDNDYATAAVIAIHRSGYLHDQSGGYMGVPFGAYWTSLPAPYHRA